MVGGFFDNQAMVDTASMENMDTLPRSPTRMQQQQTFVSGASTGRRTPIRGGSPTSRRAMSPSSASRESTLSYAFKSNGKNDDRSGYIRSTHQPLDLYYDLPGMSDSIRKSNVKGPKFATMSGDRSTYVSKGLKGGPTGLYYDLPGMASKPSSRAVDFSRGSERRASDLLKHSSSLHPGSPIVTRAVRDLVYDLPGMADELRLSRKGSASFRMTSPRFGSPARTPAHDVTQRSDANTIGHEVRTTSSPLKKSSSMSSASFKMTAPRFPSPTREGQKRFSVDAYDLPGMASSVLKSPNGTASFRFSSKRDSYVKAFQRTSDLVYDIPGMSGVIYGPMYASPGCSLVASRVGSPNRRPSSPRQFPDASVSTGPRFASPTKASAAKATTPRREE